MVTTGTVGLKWKASPDALHFGGKNAWFTPVTGSAATTAGADKETATTLPDGVYFSLAAGTYDLQIFNSMNSETPNTELKLLRIKASVADETVGTLRAGLRRGDADQVGTPDLYSTVQLDIPMVAVASTDIFYVVRAGENQPNAAKHIYIAISDCQEVRLTMTQITTSSRFTSIMGDGGRESGTGISRMR